MEGALETLRLRRFERAAESVPTQIINNLSVFQPGNISPRQTCTHVPVEEALRQRARFRSSDERIEFLRHDLMRRGELFERPICEMAIQMGPCCTK